MQHLSADICVIGAGSGGLSVAAGASQMGAKVVLFEGHKMGGDCLNYGCVPSKSLLAAAHRAHDAANSSEFGVTATPKIDFSKTIDHVHEVIDSIRPMDSVERFEGLGVTVIQAYARFDGPTTVVGGDYSVKARRVVIATGSSPFVPPIPGLDQVDYFTNETIFDNRTLPAHLLIVGGGPIGLEMAQAFCRLGAKVSVIEMAKIMPQGDAELTAVVRDHLVAEGVEIHEQSQVTEVRAGPDGPVVVAKSESGEREIAGSHLLMAVGRKPNVDNLDLARANIEFNRRGIAVDNRLRTSNKKVFAIGDVAGLAQFTHVAGYHAGIVIRNILFKLPASARQSGLPWVTYTDPELAHVGKTEEEARSAHGDIRVLNWPLLENDRARAERQTDGFIKAITAKNGRVVGASIVGAHAGELLAPWILAVENNMKIHKIAGMVAPYPTLSEIGKRAAGSYFTPSLFSERTRKIVRFLLRLW